MTENGIGTIDVAGEVQALVEEWRAGSSEMVDCFLELYNCTVELVDVSLEFVARPGVSYSLRPKHKHQLDRNLFAMVDVIDDDPEARWLSVCFYGDMISDPERKGEVIPGGLAGSDGYCFDMFEADQELTGYLKERIAEAHKKAAG